MSEPFDVTNDLIPVVEEEQDISSDFWYTDDESDTNSVIAPSDISYMSENDADDVSKSHREDDTSEVGEPLCTCTTVLPETEDSLVDEPRSHHQDIQTDNHAQLTGSVNAESVSPCGFVIMGDNIDKNFRPSFQRDNRSTKSMHYFHAFASKTRINISNLSDSQPGVTVSPENFLPNVDDYSKLLSDFEILISR